MHFRMHCTAVCPMHCRTLSSSDPAESPPSTRNTKQRGPLSAGMSHQRAHGGAPAVHRSRHWTSNAPPPPPLARTLGPSAGHATARPRDWTPKPRLLHHFHRERSDWPVALSMEAGSPPPPWDCCKATERWGKRGSPEEDGRHPRGMRSVSARLGDRWVPSHDHNDGKMEAQAEEVNDDGTADEAEDTRGWAWRALRRGSPTRSTRNRWTPHGRTFTKDRVTSNCC